MKISRTWLQKFFDAPLPSAEKIADALTFHAFEIESMEKVGDDDVLDVKVTPNRGHDCLSHRGIAKELGAILKIPLTKDSFSSTIDLSKTTDALSVSLADSSLSPRYIAGLIRGVKVGPSPEWLKDLLKSVGQKSINNVVDATNAKMFNIGQPLHAFDAQKLKQKEGKWSIEVRKARNGEKMKALDGKEYALTDSMLVISDGNADQTVGIAGVKGGMPSGITEETADIIIESANFNSVSIRKTAQALKLRTDASTRFEQGLSPLLAAYGMRAVVELIQDIAGGELVGFVDVYPKPPKRKHVFVTIEKVNNVLGTSLTGRDIADVFVRLGFSYKEEAGMFEVEVPFERLDLEIAEDLVEEVARIVGFDAIPQEKLSPSRTLPEINKEFFVSEQIREDFVSRGYSEVVTSVFTDMGEREVLNKADSVNPFLRESLIPGLKDAYEKNWHIKDLLEGPTVRIFEIGTVWVKSGEKIMVGMADDTGVSEKLLLKSKESEHASSYQNFPIAKSALYKSFSKYPYVLRDIALWVPQKVSLEEVQKIILESAGKLLIKSTCFDIFKKQGKVSYAFHLIFQSEEKTLTDEEANLFMANITNRLSKKEGWNVR